MAKKKALPNFDFFDELIELSNEDPYNLHLLICRSCLALIEDLNKLKIITKEQSLEAKIFLIEIMQKANVQLPKPKKQKNGKATNTRKNKPSGTTKTKPATKSSTNTKSKTKSNRKSK